MIPRMTTVGTLKNYRYDLNRSNNTMTKAMNTVMTGRSFTSYAEDPALATRCFQIRRSFLRTASQLEVNDSLLAKYNQAWSALDSVSQDIYAVADDTAFGSVLRAENGATASGRNALGQSLSAKARTIVQTMNGRHGENYVFGGADTLNVPFTWETKKNPDYIAPKVAQAKIEELDPAADKDEYEKYAAAFPYRDKNTGELTYTASGDTEPNPAYNEKTSYRYMREDGTFTNSESEAQTVLCYRGVPVDSNDPEDKKKMEYFMSESKYLDVGLGHKELDGEPLSSSVFDSALQGIYYLGGYGSETIKVTVGEGDDAVTKEIEIPNNIVSVINRLGTILQRCDPDNGSYASPEDEAEAQALAKKLEDQKDIFIQRYAEIDTESGFLRDNSELLTDTADSLSQQFMGLEDVDPAAAISAYMFARYCYDAALKLGNSVLSQSLMDYMNF